MNLIFINRRCNARPHSHLVDFGVADLQYWLVRLTPPTKCALGGIAASGHPYQTLAAEEICEADSTIRARVSF